MDLVMLSLIIAIFFTQTLQPGRCMLRQFHRQNPGDQKIDTISQSPNRTGTIMVRT